jgi:hypothetical protein
VRAGAGLELNDLKTFAPGKTVMVPGKAGEPLANSIMWDRPPDVTASAYAEQDRINLDFDEMTGAFTNSSVQASQIQQQSATGMHLMSGEASGMGEYELRVFAETFVEPVMRMLIKLEQAYETDEVVLALAGKSAKLYQKYGIDQITDDLLNQELTTRVNVGIGATNPQMKMKQFVDVGSALGHLFGPIAAQAANFQEIAKELFGLAGYKDGDRFIKQGFDPQVAMLQQQIQQLQAKQKMPAAAAPPDPTKLQAAQIQATSRERTETLKAQTDLATSQMDMQKDQAAQEAETLREMYRMQHDRFMQTTQPHPALAGFSG